jgi:hypothetical protein
MNETSTNATVGTMINVNSSVRTGNGEVISPSGLNDATITVIVGYAANQVTTARL